MEDNRIRVRVVRVALNKKLRYTLSLSVGMASFHLKDQKVIGVGLGFISTFRLLGGAVTTAIYTSMQTSRFSQVLPGHARRAARSSGFVGSMAALVTAAITNTEAAYAIVEGAEEL
ncbi:Fungal trichothecene efflux pump (TRI12) [Geosmithia morbida]|uniref:Fungal trichothecene efflux pump (TRI12) n=1 Tax=Geosmithia morbida TaxID=1094350 RepID=A0A9P4YMU3_9HYPO|nr:Fungal trichothecene efflux pump (TRI12) [Geosmithia morbida]KAF4119475.1 Fungal trichothecene efflux pump (TRI12) [Geosmithia morbida]